MSVPPEGNPPSRTAAPPAKRYLAGVARGFELSERDRELLSVRGARVLGYRARVGMIHLEIDDVAAFRPPSFLRFLAPDEGVTAVADDEVRMISTTGH